METADAEETPPGEGAPPHAPRRRIKTGYLIAVAILALAALVRVVVLIASAGHSASHASSARLGFAPRARLPACGASCDPIDPRYLTDVPFGRTSFWIQPWRAYLDTWPVSHLQDAVGINFNVKDAQAAATARLLHEAGFRLARLEIDWGALSYSDPTKFIHEASIRTRLSALHSFHLRPLIVLNANSGAPAPAESVTLETVAPAPAGADTVTLSPASAAVVVPDRSGFNPGVFGALPRKHRAKKGSAAAGETAPRLTPAQRRARRLANRARRRAAARAGFTPLVLHGKPAILITAVGPGDVATLSRPLPTALAGGPHRGTTLLYAPFSAPTLPDGSPNPAFQMTLAGWMGYVAAICKLTESIVGPGGYDLEIWNELTFGSQFLNIANYSVQPPGRAARRRTNAATKQVIKALLYGTVAYVRDPSHGISPAVGITDGFASESPFNGGALAPPGLTALSKHPYVGARSFPSEYHVRAVRPIDALGRPDTASKRSFVPLFVPSFQALLPEYTLTALSTETTIRDIAPITTRVSRAPHGRYVGPGHEPPLQKWITEYNIDAAATPVGPDESTPETGARLTAADRAHFHAKALLRSLVAMIGKGFSREYFFAAAPGSLSMISPSFFSALEEHPGSYPGQALGGEILTSFHNLLTHIEGPGPTGAPTQLSLVSIEQDGNHAQFTGDGTAAHPDLYDREVLAVFPYQVSPTRFMIPVYVMTRDLLTLYDPSAPSSDITRYDLPNETFRITLGNLPETADPPTVGAYDPITNQATPAKLLGRQGDTATFEFAATDYPRLLSIDYE